MDTSQQIADFILHGELFIERHYRCIGFTETMITNIDGDPILQVSDEQWCQSIALFGVLRRFTRPFGCIVEIIDPSYTDPEKVYGDIPF